LPQKDRLEGRRTLERAIVAQQQLIDDLLDVSRISAGKLRVDIRPTRLAETMEAAIEAVRPVAARKRCNSSTRKFRDRDRSRGSGSDAADRVELVE